MAIRKEKLADLHLHPELEALAGDIESACQTLGIVVEELIPPVDRCIPTMALTTVVGNWAAYRAAHRNGLQEVTCYRDAMLGVESDEVVALLAITSVVPRESEDPLLLGLVYRAWRRFERREIPLRYSRSNYPIHTEWPGKNLRDSLQREFCRRMNRSLRELQRYASILDVAPEWMRLYREGCVSLYVMERLRVLPPEEQDRLVAEYRNGTPLQELVDEVALSRERKRKRLEKAIQIFTGNLPESLTLLKERLVAELSQEASAVRTESIGGELLPTNAISTSADSMAVSQYLD